MSEFIDRLYRQAYGEEPTLVQSLDATGFAELIVKECLDCIDKLHHNSSDEWDIALRSALNEIKEKFIDLKGVYVRACEIADPFGLDD